MTRNLGDCIGVFDCLLRFYIMLLVWISLANYFQQMELFTLVGKFLNFFKLSISIIICLCCNLLLLA